jgi:hypothetical protein
MHPLFLIFVLCGVLISSTAAVDQTCKAKAAEQRLAGAAHKMLAEPASEDFIHRCVASVPHHCRDNSDCTDGTGCDVCWAGLCGQ